MIKKLVLSNFQSHKSTELNFTPGLNCIIGSTHVGKSALVRALKFVLFNNFISNSVTWNQDKCSIKIEVDNGYVERIKGKVVNKVIINNAVFDNFGDNYPQIVNELCNIKKLVLDDDQEYNLNILSQHDSLFLLNESGAIKAKALNSLIDLNIVDNVIRDLVADAGRENKIKDNLISKKAQLESEIEKYKDLDKEEAKIKKIQSIFDNLHIVVGNCEKYRQLLDKANKYKQKILEWNTKNEKIKKYDINKLNKFDKLYVSICKLNGFLVRLNEINEKISDNFYKNKKANHFLEETRSKYKQTLLEIKKCPICYSDINKEMVDNILEKL